MTERQEWLGIGRKCLPEEEHSGGHWVFLCNEVNECSLPSMRDRMKERLELFRPTDLVRGIVWWGGFADDDDSSTVELNDQRSIACGLLAAMAEEEEDDRQVPHDRLLRP